jgi:prolyl-tRNA synthetase
MLNCYADVLENWMAIPVIKGRKTEDERFPGAIDTLTVEAMMQDGKALQSATSHHLGQTFSKSFDITFQSKDGGIEHAWTTSWGLSTRSIGGLIMVHGDDDGVKIPPKIAPQQIVVIPFLKNNDGDQAILNYAQAMKERLESQNIRVMLDDRDMRAGDKGWEWIKKGVPIRVEIGAREVENGEITVTRRDLGKESKKTVSVSDFIEQAQSLLDDIQSNMFETAKKSLNDRIYPMTNLDDAREFFKQGKQGFVKLPEALWGSDDFNTLCSDFSVTPRCLPFDESDQMIIGKSY